ncbi:MAG: tRNA (adenosine(37)-N6)-threonylcarbamoyltransferase complex transferase subunit TsaD, partial [Planctomycetes bacterium]|nr:tRNA (adenosine(37)-N6)-threonylcarbamoyltransferase complex transferase subunit TsaD [Planctomycetota bacterium]
DVAASFQEAVVDVLAGKCRLALESFARRRLCVGGGVAANQRFRRELESVCRNLQAELILSPLEYCTDNAAMGGIAWELFNRGEFSGLDLDITPGLVRRHAASK